MLRLYETRLATGASRALGRIAEMDVSPTLLRPFIAAYARVFGIEMDDIVVPEGGFRRFGDFFVRRLQPGARPVCQDGSAFISPCDGFIVDCDLLGGNAEVDFSIKGDRYVIGSLLGDADAGERYKDGGYMVVYLHPRDYHRVHVPVDARLKTIRHIPGTRYPVADWAAGRVDGIYQKNERVVFEFDLANGGQLSLTMISAFGVGHIEIPFFTGWSKYTQELREHRFEEPLETKRGEDLGAFRLGSTVVMAWTRDAIGIDDAFIPGPTEFGKRIGKAKLEKTTSE